MVLESHVVYSWSKEKTAAHFYIKQSTQSIREDLQVPIKDVLKRLLLRGLLWIFIFVYEEHLFCIWKTSIFVQFSVLEIHCFCM
ncbi:unnamed protein product [Camellia sinensis]